jgi:hypothetical protein
VTTWPAAHQIFEEFEFARLQWQDFAGAGNGAGEQVHFQIGGFQPGVLRLIAGPPAEAFDASQKFGKGIGLAEIVVAAGPQALDPLVDIAEGAENQHRRPDAFVAQLADDGEAVELRQHAVDDQNVMHTVAGQRQAPLAIGGEVGT